MISQTVSDLTITKKAYICIYKYYECLPTCCDWHTKSFGTFGYPSYVHLHSDFRGLHLDLPEFLWHTWTTKLLSLEWDTIGYRYRQPVVLTARTEATHSWLIRLYIQIFQPVLRNKCSVFRKSYLELTLHVAVKNSYSGRPFFAVSMHHLIQNPADDILTINI